jgi:hypothetical protein
MQPKNYQQVSQGCEQFVFGQIKEIFLLFNGRKARDKTIGFQRRDRKIKKKIPPQILGYI